MICLSEVSALTFNAFVLSLLDQKTRGNLTVEERQFLEQALYELRLRFVEATSGGRRIIEP